LPNILILGTNGQIARVAIDLLLKETDAHLTLYLRNTKRLRLSGHADRVRIFEGDVLDAKALEAAMAGQDVVYANLTGQLEQQARNIVKTMDKVGIKRLIFISSMSVYDEIPGEHHGSILDPFARQPALSKRPILNTPFCVRPG
jgi:nucleoside-diphosphate-sugar epimerase